MDNVNDFLTSAGNLIDETYTWLRKRVFYNNPDKFAKVNKDLVGEPCPEGIWNGDYNAIRIPSSSENQKEIEDSILENNGGDITITSGTVDEVNIPERITGETKITAPLGKNATITSQGTGELHINNTSPEPVNLTLSAPTTSTVYLSGKFDTMTVDTSIEMTGGSVENVVISDQVSNGVSINAPMAKTSSLSSDTGQPISIYNINPIASVTIATPKTTVSVEGDYSEITCTKGGTVNLMSPKISGNVTSEEGLINIYGGEYKGLLVKKEDGNIKSFGGKYFNNDPASYVGEGFVSDARRIGDNIEYTVLSNSHATVTAAIKAGGSVTLKEDLVILERKSLTLTKDVTLDLGGHGIDSFGGTRGDTIEIQKATVTIKNGHIKPAVGYVDNGATIAVMGTSNVTLENIDVEGERCVLNSASNNNILIKSGTYTSPNISPAVYFSAGSNSKVVIEGGTFKSNPPEGSTNYTLNIKDDLVPAGTDVRNFIEVKGGTFIGFNPAGSMGEPGGPVNFVADGFEAKEVEKGVWEVTKAL